MIERVISRTLKNYASLLFYDLNELRCVLDWFVFILDRLFVLSCLIILLERILFDNSFASIRSWSHLHNFFTRKSRKFYFLLIQRYLDFSWYVKRVSVPKNWLGLRCEVDSVIFHWVWPKLLSLRDALQVNFTWVYLQFFQFFGEGILELFRFVQFRGKGAGH